MHISPLDLQYVDDLVNRLAALEPGVKPAWGRMRAEELIPHLLSVLKYSMGRRGSAVDDGNWLTKKIIGPLILSGIMPVFKNVKGLSEGELPAETGDLETLHAVLEEYLHLVQTGELEPLSHPVFGAIGIDGWARMHVIHFEHHLRQFGL